MPGITRRSLIAAAAVAALSPVCALASPPAASSRKDASASADAPALTSTLHFGRLSIGVDPSWEASGDGDSLAIEIPEAGTSVLLQAVDMEGVTGGFASDLMAVMMYGAMEQPGAMGEGYAVTLDDRMRAESGDTIWYSMALEIAGDGGETAEGWMDMVFADETMYTLMYLVEDGRQQQAREIIEAMRASVTVAGEAAPELEPWESEG